MQTDVVQRISGDDFVCLARLKATSLKEGGTRRLAEGPRGPAAM